MNEAKDPSHPYTKEQSCFIRNFFQGMLSWYRGLYIRRLYRIKIHGIRNLIRWFPVIWNDRDYDWEFVLKIIEKKIVFMRGDFANSKFYVGWEKDVASMDKVLDLIDKIKKDKYAPTEHGTKEKERDWSNLFDCLKENLRYWWW